MAFKNGVKSIQTARYNGARMVDFMNILYFSVSPYVLGSSSIWTSQILNTNYLLSYSAGKRSGKN